MKKSVALSVLFLVVAVASGSRARAQEGAPGVEKAGGNLVRTGIWKLHGFDPSLPSDDLAPLKGLLARASVVGLGEPIHTTGGVYQMKDRLIRYLVAQMGYRLIAWESPTLGAERLEAYVQSCSGTPDEGLQTIFAVWQSTEVREMAQWLCDWNRGHGKAKDKVHVIGVDIQDLYGQTRSDVANLRAYLARVGVGAVDRRSADLDLCDGVLLTEEVVSPERYAACSGALSAIDRLFTGDAARLTRLTSKRDLGFARIYWSSVHAWEDEVGFFDDYAVSVSARDRGMAYTLVHLRELRYPNAKTIVWAHDTHLSKANTWLSQPDVSYMGMFLAQALGTKFQSIGISAYDTEVDWANLELCGHVDRIGVPGSVEEHLYDLSAGDVLVDLKNRAVIPAVIPAGRVQLGYYEILPDRHYDLLISLDRSPKMNPLAWPSCR